MHLLTFFFFLFPFTNSFLPDILHQSSEWFPLDIFVWSMRNPKNTGKFFYFFFLSEKNKTMNVYNHLYSKQIGLSQSIYMVWIIFRRDAVQWLNSRVRLGYAIISILLIFCFSFSKTLLLKSPVFAKQSYYEFLEVVNSSTYSSGFWIACGCLKLSSIIFDYTRITT